MRAVLGIVVVASLGAQDASATDAMHCDSSNIDYQALEGYVPVEILSRRPPEYPYAQISRGIEGQVTFQFDIGRNGRPRNIDVVASEPRGAFDRGARRALRDWEYRPHTINGEVTICEGLRAAFEFQLPGWQSQ